MITADSTREAVHSFAQSVRDALADLPADEIDELTDGLEADLAERADELGGTDGFGDPVAYADELRASAGLPDRAAAGRRATPPELRALIAARWRAAASAVRGNPFGAWLIDLLASLRPVWWVLRGWIVWQLCGALFFHETFAFLPLNAGLAPDPVPAALLLALVLFSVQWGRGRWMPGRWARGLLIALSAVSVLAIPFVLAWAINASWSAGYAQSSTDVSTAEQVPAPTPTPTTAPTHVVYGIEGGYVHEYTYTADGMLVSTGPVRDEYGNPLRAAPTPAETPATTPPATPSK
jgi:hypothetical protein